MKLEYTEIKDNKVLVGVFRSDGVFIPANEANSDYQAYLATLPSELVDPAPTEKPAK